MKRKSQPRWSIERYQAHTTVIDGTGHEWRRKGRAAMDEMGYFSPLRVTQLTINQTTTIRFARIIPQTPVSILLSLAILYLPKQFIIYVSNTKYEENENLNSRIIMGLFVPTAASVTISSLPNSSSDSQRRCVVLSLVSRSQLHSRPHWEIFARLHIIEIKYFCITSSWYKVSDNRLLMSQIKSLEKLMYRKQYTWLISYTDPCSWWHCSYIWLSDLLLLCD